MSKMVRVVVMRGGQRVVRFRRRPQPRSTPPETLWPMEPVRGSVTPQVRQLEKDVRDGVRQMKTVKGRRALRVLMKPVLGQSLWWWRRIRRRMVCPQWLLTRALDEVHRCQAWWLRVRLRMLVRRRRTKQWLMEWLVETAIHGRPCRLLTCACT